MEFLSRNSANLGDRVFRCNTLQNPLAFYDGKAFNAIDIASVSDSFTSKSEGIYLRDKSIVSVGLKKSGDEEKFVGFRPDEVQDGSEQFEMSLEKVEIDGNKKSIDLTDMSSEMISGSPSISSNKVYVTVYGGTDGTTYNLRLRVVTTNGDQIEDDLDVVVIQKGQ